MVPIVMGAHPSTYKRVAPPHSYIHVDDYESPAALARYLHRLDANDDLYSEYFRWKGSGDLKEIYMWCRLCALLHAHHHKPSTNYRDISEWWAPHGICNHGVHHWITG